MRGRESMDERGIASYTGTGVDSAPEANRGTVTETSSAADRMLDSSFTTTANV